MGFLSLALPSSLGEGASDTDPNTAVSDPAGLVSIIGSGPQFVQTVTVATGTLTTDPGAQPSAFVVSSIFSKTSPA